MNIIRHLFTSSLGKKLVMAISGAGLVLFLVGHMVGNLQIFLPPEAINRYGHFLHSAPELLWIVRLGMLTLIGLHVWSATHLWKENRAARPVPYLTDPSVATSALASRTMIMSGLIIAAFVVYHLLHYTVQAEGVNGTPILFSSLKETKTGYNDVYAMVIAGFSVWYVSLFYIVAVGLLCLHLSHGVSAMFQSLGLVNTAYRAVIDKLAKVLAIALFLGYVSIPVAVKGFGLGKDYLKEVTQPGKAAAVAQEVTR